MNFTVRNLSHWIRYGQDHVNPGPRPHVIPTTPDAVEFVHDVARGRGKPIKDTVFGGFNDAISIVNVDGCYLPAFRFLTLDPDEDGSAIAIAEIAFQKWLKKQEHALAAVMYTDLGGEG